MPTADSAADSAASRPARRRAHRGQSWNGCPMGRPDLTARQRPAVPWPGAPQRPAQRPATAMSRRELLLRRAIPGVLAAVLLVFVLVPLVLGLAAAGVRAARIFGG